MKYASLEERLLALSVEDPEGTGCWLWLGARSKTGYGYLNVYGHPERLAHRVAYRVFKGVPPPKWMDVHHTCGTRWCINPEHLELVRHRENCQTGKRRNLPNGGSFKKSLTGTV